MKIILKSICYRRFTPSVRQTPFTIIILCMGWKQLFLEMKKNVPWHILAERFLLYRKAISCKVKKTTHPRLIYCQQTLWSLFFFMFISIFFCRLPLRRPPYWKHPVFCKSAVYGISHLRWSYSVLPQFFLLTYHLPAILKSLS